MNKAIDAIGRLEHLANRSAYEYTAEQVEAMFGALENKVADVKEKFSTKKQDNTSSAMTMECHLWQCTGSIDSITWSAGTMTSTESIC